MISTVPGQLYIHISPKNHEKKPTIYVKVTGNPAIAYVERNNV